MNSTFCWCDRCWQWHSDKQMCSPNIINTPNFNPEFIWDKKTSKNWTGDKLGGDVK
jgi:hypothetical protein